MKTLLRILTACCLLFSLAPIAFADVIWTPTDQAFMYARMYALPVLLVAVVLTVSAVILYRIMKNKKK
ncbi:MAG: hypothetical protein IJC45_00715 [Clostridia bacterium]|nr:hypothetical protein [Clostridia bacterium]